MASRATRHLPLMLPGMVQRMEGGGTLLGSKLVPVQVGQLPVHSKQRHSVLARDTARFDNNIVRIGNGSPLGGCRSAIRQSNNNLK